MTSKREAYLSLWKVADSASSCFLFESPWLTKIFGLSYPS